MFFYFLLLTAFFVLNCLSKVLQLRVLVILGGLSSALCSILDSQAPTIEIVTISHIFNGKSHLIHSLTYIRIYNWNRNADRVIDIALENGIGEQ